MSFVDTYQVGSLRWRRDLRADDVEEESPGFSSTTEALPASAIPSGHNGVDDDRIDSRGK